MECPLISVLIPVFNVEPFIQEAIQSIQLQTYSNLEIIIVDDCSTDSTYTICCEIAKSDSRIKLYRNSYNMKIARSLNFAFSKSNGDFIARMDGDDVSLPNKLEIQFNYLLLNQNVDLVGTNYLLVDENKKILGATNYLEFINEHIGVVKYESPVAHIWLARRELYLKIGDYRMSGVEDYDFLLRALSFGFIIRNIPQNLYMVRLRNGNTVNSMGLEQRKAFKFAYSLYKFRTVYLRSDNFNEISFKNKIRTNSLEKYLYMKSSLLYEKHLINKNKSIIKALFYLICSILFFPTYQIKYLNNRIILKLLYKK
jgi:glycosyltransferase involved in cell wall biosynthesis